MGDLRRVSFIREGNRAGAELKESKGDAPPEAWLSLWDGRDMEGCAALQWGAISKWVRERDVR